MKSLDDRINNLIATKKDFKIIDISKYGAKVGNQKKTKINITDWTITSNTTIFGVFRYADYNNINKVGSLCQINPTKSNFSVTSTNDIYSGVLSREGNSLYIASPSIRNGAQVAKNSYLLFTDSL